ncbi:uncharacterized protein CELE_C34C6.7 [Caenorhabditis elegans]|uniref:Uncharacterized protein n=2 Tax=Caenorhabditis elegans TaxID=6239 RepID=B7WN88_CAEEL|nr:Uncharacterized protein CELE_C34C6.7 [Caenorhabditis elegans]CAV31766.1 Uncharacterized protein CELE_C34C6.7 [Caenorhabditis elegans]|eukprot:NP_001254181.1 Uncharacterized protein CELE_C34C6.7 [Caenorhabditis elegans]
MICWLNLSIFYFVFSLYQCHQEELSQNIEVTASDSAAEHEVFEGISSNIAGKGEKLEEEIDNIGIVMQPEPRVVHEASEVSDNIELNIKDDLNLKSRLDNFTRAKFRQSTTVTPNIVAVEPSIEGVEDDLDHDEQGEPEDSEIRNRNEHHFAELGGKMKERRDHVDDPDIQEPLNKPISAIPEETSNSATIQYERSSSGTQNPQTSLNIPTAQNVPKLKQLKNQEILKDHFISEVSDVSNVADVSAPIVISQVPEILNGEPAGVPANFEEEDKERVEEEEDRISWDLIHFLLLLSPYEEGEVTWWTIVLEAVKCSLRSCHNSSSHWHDRSVYLPRITRHRRQDSDYLPGALSPTTPKPCLCNNLETYFEKLYESVGKKKKEKKISNSTTKFV